MNNVNINQRNKQLIVLLTHFRSKWKNEYLKYLREQYKASKGNGSALIKIGDKVLIDDFPKSRMLWKVGIVSIERKSLSLNLINVQTLVMSRGAA